MTAVKQRYLYKESGACRHASEYVYDPRDLDANGNPPGWFLPHTPIVADDDEVEFDHPASQIEIALAFKKRSLPDAQGQ